MTSPKQIFNSLLITWLVSAGAAFATVPDAAVELLKPVPEHANTTRNIVDALASRHYVSTLLDDDLSTKIFDNYIDDLDPSKSYFLASDIRSFERLRFDLDNALRRGDVGPAFEIFNVYHGRVIARFEQVIANLEADIDQYDFTIDEALVLDRSDAPFAEAKTELDDLWRKRIKNAVLNLKLADKELAATQELLVKRYQNRLSRTLQTNSEDVYQLYMNSFTKTYDPHTQYFSPRTSENFNINMSLSLEGIGAVLQREDEFTKVVSLVPAGPADKSKSIFPDDKIVAVGQDDSDMVDVIGWRLDEVVQLIRGKKDTVVRLDVISASDPAQSKIIELTRSTVKLEEQSAHSKVIEIEQFGAKSKIGVIDIPTFYIDFQALQAGESNYKSTTRDVQKLLVELMQEGVEGVVIDLRDNGGGSLQEAKTLTGLFIDRGPTVQIRSKSNRVDILNDRDIRTIYDGPLAVLVNRLSASASEIFAGAIQDYERGLIIGNQTFGKGTVQSLLPLNRGQLKLTQAKFYRISGESTQHKGIVPDITFPNDFDPESIGESSLEAPLPWDKIKATGYRTKRSIVPLLGDLRIQHEERAARDPEFHYMEEALAYRQERRKIIEVTLNEANRLQEKDDADAFWLGLENSKRKAQGLEAIASLDDLKKKTVTPELAAAEGNEVVDNEMAGIVDNITTEISETLTELDDLTKTADEVAEEAKPDAYLIETGHILLDMIASEKRTADKQ
ncbi:MAG: carboxyl-terminal processing protease [Candidatus Azotimanducaceae bacterium]|jgi:carboxyl-terminal processing protease